MGKNKGENMDENAVEIESGTELPAAPLADDVFCLNCGYNLRGTASKRCPECGEPVQDSLVPVRGLAWTKPGLLFAYPRFWQTAWTVTFRPGVIWRQFFSSVPLRGALSFQLLAVLHIFLPVLLGTILIYRAFPPSTRMGMSLSLVSGGYAAIWPVAVMLGCLLAFLISAMRAPAYFFEPAAGSLRQRSNATAMSHYACAPLAFFPIMILLLGAITLAYSMNRWDLRYLKSIEYWPLAAIGVAAALSAAGWWLGLVRLMRRTMPQRPARQALLSFGLPFVLLVLGLLWLLVVPALILFLVLVVASLTI